MEPDKIIKELGGPESVAPFLRAVTECENHRTWLKSQPWDGQPECPPERMEAIQKMRELDFARDQAMWQMFRLARIQRYGPLCEVCDGHGDREIDVDTYETCSACKGTGHVISANA